LVLGVLRAGGDLRSRPATNGELQKLSQRLASLGAGHDEWAAALALDGHADFADQAVALAHYDRAVGLWALVHGVEAAKHALTEKILNDPAIAIYAGGRSRWPTTTTTSTSVISAGRFASTVRRRARVRAVSRSEFAVDAHARLVGPAGAPPGRGDAPPARSLRAHGVHALRDRRRVPGC